MKTTEILKLLEDEVSYFGDLSFSIEFFCVVIQRKVPRRSFSKAIFLQLIELCTKYNLSFFVMDDQIYVFNDEKK